MTLAITVAQGVQRQDTAHPAFCGCIDWHSCVHGVYALLTTSRLTDDPQWSETAESLLSPDKLEEVLRFLPLFSGLVCSLLISEPRPPQAMTKRPFLEPPRLSAETALL